MDDSKTLTNDHTVLFKIKRAIYFICKRIGDILVSLIGLVLLIPITIIIKIAYMCTGDFHSIIFTQDRIGKGG